MCDTPRVPPRPANSRRPATWLLAAVLLAAVACAERQGRVTTAEQQSFGSRTFAAPFDATFTAARDALPLLGYTLLFADPRTGRITTEKLAAGARAEIGFGGRLASTLYRQYDLRLQPVGPASTLVVAVPRMYAGERDISHEPVWILDGPSGEHARWRALFDQIDTTLCSQSRVGR